MEQQAVREGTCAHLMKHRFRKIYDTRSDTQHEWWHVVGPKSEGGSLLVFSLVATVCASCCCKPLGALDNKISPITERTKL